MFSVSSSDDMNVTLEEMLALRDRRMQKQMKLLSDYQNTLICFTLNIAGPKKCFPLAEKTFLEGHQILTDQIARDNIKIVMYQQTMDKTGYCGFYIMAAPAVLVKKIAVAIEDSHPLGRLFDIDILYGEYNIISRKDIGAPARKCILCDSPAVVCSRSRAHPLPEVFDKTIGIMRSYFTNKIGFQYAKAAARALLYEVNVTPKPGLVDCSNNGAHKDMDRFMFIDSTSALIPFYFELTVKGLLFEGSADELFHSIRHIGQRAEYAMFAATKGVNTHKGAIFSIGIICAAAGYLYSQNKLDCVDTLLEFCAKMTSSSLNELKKISKKINQTNGEQAFLQYGIPGIRGEASGGFPHVRDMSLPLMRKLQNQGIPINNVGVIVLLHLIAHVDDTNIIARSSINKMHEMQKDVQALLDSASKPEELITAAGKLDKDFIQDNISPGGCADLLAITFFLYFLFPNEQD